MNFAETVEGTYFASRFVDVFESEIKVGGEGLVKELEHIVFEYIDLRWGSTHWIHTTGEYVLDLVNESISLDLQDDAHINLHSEMKLS